MDMEVVEEVDQVDLVEVGVVVVVDLVGKEEEGLVVAEEVLVVAEEDLVDLEVEVVAVLVEVLMSSVKMVQEDLVEDMVALAREQGLGEALEVRGIVMAELVDSGLGLAVEVVVDLVADSVELLLLQQMMVLKIPSRSPFLRVWLGPSLDQVDKESGR